MPYRSGDPVLRSSIANGAVGAMLGMSLPVLMLITDTAGLGTLLRSDPAFVPLLIVITLLFAVGFAVLAFATGLFLLGPASPTHHEAARRPTGLRNLLPDRRGLG